MIMIPEAGIMMGTLVIVFFMPTIPRKWVINKIDFQTHKMMICLYAKVYAVAEINLMQA
jgi:hypothetical protein